LAVFIRGNRRRNGGGSRGKQGAVSPVLDPTRGAHSVSKEPGRRWPGASRPHGLLASRCRLADLLLKMGIILFLKLGEYPRVAVGIPGNF
jgi:hypothetical protein